MRVGAPLALAVGADPEQVLGRDPVLQRGRLPRHPPPHLRSTMCIFLSTLILSRLCLCERGRERGLELQTNHRRSFHNHGEDPYQGLLLVARLLVLSHLKHY